MKYNRTLLTFLMCCSIIFSFSQRSAYYDALYLKAQFDKNSSLKIVPANRLLFEYYYGKLSDDALEDSIGGNPFLNAYFKTQQAEGILNEIIPKNVSSVGSLNVTNIADGIAQFLIKRGKEELNVAFFNRLKKFLDSTEECKVLFPQSIEVFNDVEPYQYAEFIQTLREAFKKDLSNLVEGVNELIELPKYKELLKNLPEIYVAVRSAKIVQELSQSDGGILPDSIITQLAALGEFGKIDLNLDNAWKLLNVISQSVRYVPNNNGDTTQSKDLVTRRWITISDMNALVKDLVAFQIFLGLVYQKVQGIYFKANTVSISVQEFLKQNADNILSVSGLFENFVTLANDVDRTIKDFKDKQKNNLLTTDDYYTYIDKAINITEYGFKAANVIFRFGSLNKNISDLSDNRYIIIAKNGNDLYRNIYTKNYSNAIMNVYNIIDQIFNHKEELVQEKINAGNLNNTASASLIANTKSITLLNSKVIEAILKYGNFMAAIVKAESGEEVESALEAAALPAGSYSIKQKALLNVSVNGYVGYAWDFNSGLYAHGIYAPVGLSVSTGSNKKHGITFSAFVSLIDVGSIVTYRLQDDSTKTLKQEVKLESIFSPSAQLFIEPIHSFPLTIGGGWRRTPKLFYTNDATLTTVTPKNVFNLSVLIDIPIFTITNKPFVKK